MSQHDETPSGLETKNLTGISRRSLVKSAAWSAPVIAIAVAAPFASASVGNATSLSWTASESTLLALQLLDGGTVLNASVAPTLPTQFTFVNGPGAITAKTATITITVGHPTGVSISVGRGRGFGVYKYNSGVTSAGQRTTVYAQAFGAGIGFPITTYTATQVITVASNGSLIVPVEFGVAGTHAGIALNALSSFPVTLSVDFGGGHKYTATTSIGVPVNAGVL